MMHKIIWKVRTCRQGVKPPLPIITDKNHPDYLDWEHDYLKDDNVIEISFADNGGFVTTVTLQVFEFNTDIRKNFVSLTQ